MDVQQGIRRVDSVYSDSLDGISIRLLRFSQPEEGVFVGKLQTFRLASAPHFFTASYVWGEKSFSKTTIHLNNGPLPVLTGLVPFLHMVTEHGDFNERDWWWIDSLCINLDDGQEREEQIRIMAEIYKRSRRAIIWLGETIEGDSDCTGAIEFLHDLSTMYFSKGVTHSSDDHAVQQRRNDPQFFIKCKAITNLLFRPWWTRVWTLQEFVLPKEAKLYCGPESISRGKFKSAVYSIFLCSTLNRDFDNELIPRKAFDGAFNRRRIHQWHTRPQSPNLSLVSIMAYLGNHSATDPRDRIFSVLGLISSRDRKIVGYPEYTSSIEQQFANLVRSFWKEYDNIDIICFVHLFSRYTGPVDPGSDHAVPWWAPDWRAMIDFASPVPLMVSQTASEHIGNFRPLRSKTWNSSYEAPGLSLRKKADVRFSDNLKELWCNGVILDTVHGLGGLDNRELRCKSFVCAEEGHTITQSGETHSKSPKGIMLPTDWLESIARAVVLDRQDKYLCFHASTHYVTDFLYLCHACIADEPIDWSFATWFDYNRNLRFGEQTLEEIIKSIPLETPSSPPPIHRPPSYPLHRKTDAETHFDDTFLTRFHDTVRKKARRLAVTTEGLVSMTPCRSRPGDVIAILFGCSIPLVLRNRGEREAWQVIGEAYAHGYMNGEVAKLIRKNKKRIHRFRLV